MIGMRREGYIVEEIVEYQNLAEAFDQVMSGTKRKRSRQGRFLMAHREEVICRVGEEIRSGKFRVKASDLKEDDVVEGGKQRHIQFFKDYRKSIALHAIMCVVDRYLKRRFIRTTSASIEGRGLHDLMLYIRDDIRRDAEGTRYCYVFDIVKCYENTEHDVAMAALRHVFKDERLLGMLETCVRVPWMCCRRKPECRMRAEQAEKPEQPERQKGVSIGLRSSQGIVNLILSVHVDHRMKSGHGYRHYYRYCDNGMVLCGTKRECREAQDLIRGYLGAIGYEVHKERVLPVSEGIDALGYVIYPDHVLLRRRIKQNFARKMHRVKSRRRRRELTVSFYGMAKHADCNNLFKKLTGREMKSFKDLNVSYRPEDGKKRFPGMVTSIRELVNLPIVVVDCETGIKTGQGEGRYIVSIEQDGVAKKFFTNGEEMKNILDQVRAMEDGFPFETVIRAEKFGNNKTKYVFT